MISIEEAKEKVIKAGIKLVETGLIARTWGNVSHRIDGGQFVITPSGREYRSLKPDDIVSVRISDCSYSGSIKPSSEKGVHAEVYKRFPDAIFVIHTHQEYASVISACGIDSITVKPGYDLAGEIICAEYGLPSTKKLQRNVAAALPRSQGTKAVIMKHHGALVYGADDVEAFRVAMELERVCRDYTAAEYRKQGTDTRFEQEDRVAGRKPYLVSRRMEEGFLLMDGDKELKVRFDERESSLPEEAEIYRQIYRRHAPIRFTSWSVSPEVLAFSRSEQTSLKPLLDDFAQIVGTSVKVVENSPAEISSALKRASAVFIRGAGALISGGTESDMAAVGMVLEKNCKAFWGAGLFGTPKPIHPIEAQLMRFIYLKKYSKQA
ncbi:class II aldolase/adducin family protein [Gorillibacterium massiliense]|uniref:class II aldolase/adducin family protein n=1 Tax=Gorillibacterium massiliense TaxID=1280390 RepID=UPI0004BA5BA9|nr:class II aldolase/adducin family protein [Gorillibacterium massiliense]